MTTLVPKYTQVNTSNRTMTEKFAESLSVKDFGATGDGITDDTTAIENAIAAAIGKTLDFTGTFLISSTLTISNQMKISFGGGGGSNTPISYLKKAASMTTSALHIAASGVIVEGGGVYGVTGNTGDGITIFANSVTLNSVTVYNCGNDGIRVGQDANNAANNFNNFAINNCFTVGNGRYGVYIHDGTPASNTNSGVIVKLFTQSNISDGLRLGNAYWNTFTGCSFELNGGYGYTFTSQAVANVMIGGDNEGNTSGIGVDLSTTGNVFIFGTNNYLPTQSSSNCGYGQNTLVATSSNLALSAFGPNALRANTTGNANTAVGNSALTANTTGTNNTAIGSGALATNISNISCTAVGDSALNVSTANNNTAVGRNAFVNATSGGDNTALGKSAGQAVTSGANNTLVGVNAGNDAVATLTTQSNYVVLGNNSTANANIKVAWTVTSDARDKTNIGAVPYGLDFVQALKPVSYQMKTSREDFTPNGSVRYGFLAQDILALEETPVIINAEDIDNLKYNESSLIPVLVKAIQELKAEVELLKAR